MATQTLSRNTTPARTGSRLVDSVNEFSILEDALSDGSKAYCVKVTADGGVVVIDCLDIASARRLMRALNQCSSSVLVRT